MLRLRQIALAAHDLEATAKAFETVFGLKIAYRDPLVATYGLANVVMPAGKSFIEIVSPRSEEASALRFLKRRGGDAGYMLILQCANAAAETARATGLGARVVESLNSRVYAASHFHPADFGGVLVSFDQQKTAPDPAEDFCDWTPAGADWRDARSDEVLALEAVSVETADPQGLCARWAALCGGAVRPDAPHRLDLGMGEVEFIQARAEAATVFCGARLKVRSIEGCLDRARAAGLEVLNNAVVIGGVAFALVS
jgi:hypothetical protein